MLVITGKTGESVNIGDGIEVKVLSVRGPQVRLGIAAPADMVVESKKLRAHRQAKQKEGACESTSSS